MDITIAVVTYNAARCLQPCLESLLNQVPHGGTSEILVVDGCSNDGTQEIVRSFSNRVRLVENPKRTISSNRNVALQEAHYPYIGFTDADCVVPNNWLHTLSKSFEQIRQTDNRLAGVGGGNVTPSYHSSFHKALGIALDSFLGSLGSVQGKVFDRQRPVASLAGLNVLYERAALKSVGGFDEEMGNMCEDADVNYRLRRAGRTLYFVPGANVEHRARQDMGAWCSNMYAYGVGRARMIRKHRTFFPLGYLCALMFIPTLMSATAFGFVWPWAFIAWLYLPLMVCAGFILALRKKAWALSPYVVAVLIATHFCYASGLLRGLICRE